MLTANEFTIGRLIDAAPPSLVLPRTRHEAAFLVGQIEQDRAAIFLSGQHMFHVMKCSEAEHWAGLIIPNVGLELDETSLFDPQSADPHFETIVRTGTHLVVLGKPVNSYGGSTSLILERALPQTQNLTAAFARWRIVIGEGQDKRVLREVDSGQRFDATNGLNS